MIDFKTYLDNVVKDPSVFYGEVKPSFIIEFQERCFVVTCEKLRKDLKSLGISDGIYVSIITEETKDVPSSLDENKVFLFCENKPRKNSAAAKIISGIVKKLFPDKEFNLTGRRGLTSLVGPPSLPNLVVGKYNDILSVSKNIDDTSKELYVKILAVMKNGKKSILQKYVSPMFKMYNELVVPKKADLVVSGGIYNSLEVSRILSQIGPNGKLLGFEPDKTRYLELKNLKFRNFEIKPNALSNRAKSVYYFDDKSDKPKISKSGSAEISLTTIDTILNGKECDLIKLNINGTELDALEGAKSTIKNCKPKIQVLLEPKNIVAIPKLLLSYNEDYTFYLGYYDKFNNLNNIILYAI